MNRQTYQAKPGQVQQDWYVVDATDLVLGRLSAKLAVMLMGKHKPQYTPHVDVGDYIIVLNADKIRLTGDKLDHKVVKRYSGYPSGLTEKTYRWAIEHQPEELIENAVRRMLPKSRLGRQMLKKLKVYRGAEHGHQAQQPQELTI